MKMESVLIVDCCLVLYFVLFFMLVLWSELQYSIVPSTYFLAIFLTDKLEQKKSYNICMANLFVVVTTSVV